VEQQGTLFVEPAEPKRLPDLRMFLRRRVPDSPKAVKTILAPRQAAPGKASAGAWGAGNPMIFGPFAGFPLPVNLPEPNANTLLSIV
jgi:hypothetical protein